MLVEVLLLHRHLDRADVLAGISAALSVARSMPMWWRWKPAGPPNSAPASVRHPAAVRAPRCSGSLSTA